MSKLKKRDWSNFVPSLFKLVGISVFLSLGITLINNNHIVFGIFSILTGLILAILLALPKRKNQPINYVGKTIDLKEINNFFPELRKVAIAGVSNVGKSTFCNNLLLREAEERITQQIEVHVTTFPNNTSGFFGLLDGPGHSMAHQFSLIKEANILLIFLDHIYLTESKDFMEQIRNYMSQNNLRLKKIVLVLNKSDIWESNKDLQSWFDAEILIWQNANFADLIESKSHSNLYVKDLIKLVKIILE